MPANDPRTSSYLVGIGVSHSIAPPMHDFVAKSLGYDWKFTSQECPTVEDAMQLFREPSFAGGVVTMPYKVSIMQHLDGLDKHAKLLKACNNVYRASDGSLRGTNTDWRGIKGCLESVKNADGRQKPALLVGAGGAARAAIYVLYHEMSCKPIYVANRDEEEVQALLEETKAYGDNIELVHLKTIDQAKDVSSRIGFPYYVVGTVPDAEPQQPGELEVAKILNYFFSNAPNDGGVKGVVLDMCFKPRQTRMLKLAQKHGWETVEGTGVIGYQIQEQYRLWCGNSAHTSESPITEEIQNGAWEVLTKAAEDSKLINF